MGTWSIPIDRLIAKANTDAETFIRKVTIDLFGRVIARSPVDTGRFRANWQCTLDAAATTPTASTDKDGLSTTDTMTDAVMAFPVGRVSYLSNALDYAYRLEYDGWSKQAPMGMIRLTAREFDSAVQGAVTK